MRTDVGMPGRVAIFGAPLDTSNLGVSALGLATMGQLHERVPDLEVTLFDNGRGARPLPSVPSGGPRVVRRGAWLSRRVHRTESLLAMNAAARLAPWANANVRAIDESAAVLDISGGDSFTDLYGSNRFRWVAMAKEIVLARRRPLVLLPQTYGPFADPGAAARAARIVEQSERAWARDVDSFERLRELTGSGFDPERHRLGVDVAFGLRASPEHLPDSVAGIFDGHTVVGVNVSGLLYRDPQRAAEQFGLRCDYRSMMRQLLERLLESTSTRILLVPHVRALGEENDTDASEHLAAQVADPERVMVLTPEVYEADTTKAVIARLDWFIGSRMHSTVAALSSGVPACGLAYSLKFRGVFAACGMEHRVVDARRLVEGDLLDACMEAYRGREDDRHLLRSSMSDVWSRLDEEFDDLASLVTRQRESM